MSETLQLRVTGMTCGGCENAVKQTLRRQAGVESVTASHTQNSVGVTYDPSKVDRDTIAREIEKLGYQVA